jgi:hypothetical protein
MMDNKISILEAISFASFTNVVQVENEGDSFDSEEDDNLV